MPNFICFIDNGLQDFEKIPARAEPGKEPKSRGFPRLAERKFE